MSKFKKILLQIHLWLGLSSGLLVVIVALSGASLAFQEEFQNTVQHKYFWLDEIGHSRLSLNVLRDTVVTHFPKEKINDIRFQEKENACYIFYTKDRLISINPYTAAITGVRDKSTDPFTVLLKLHTTLYCGDIGEVLVEWNALVFFILCLSGLILWWPKRMRYFKQSVTIPLKTRNFKLINYKLHSVLGFYALLILFVISLTGVFWKFKAMKHFVSLVTTGHLLVDKEEVKAGTAKPLSITQVDLEGLYLKAKADFPGAADTRIGMDRKNKSVVRVLMRYPYKVIRRQNELFYNATDGHLVKANLYKHYSGYDNVAKSIFDFHTGRIKILGMFSKMIYFFVALIGATLPVSGTIIWIGRKRKKSLRRIS